MDGRGLTKESGKNLNSFDIEGNIQLTGIPRNPGQDRWDGSEDPWTDRKDRCVPREGLRMR